MPVSTPVAVRSLLRAVTIAFVPLVAGAASAGDGPPFVFVAEGLGPIETAAGMGSGAAAADFDDDGWIDVFIPTDAGTPNRLLRNVGGTFEDVAAARGLASTLAARTALFFDADGDGDLDLVVGGDDPADASMHRLYLRDGGVFTDATAGSGLERPLPEPAQPGTDPHFGGYAAGDLDGDGDLDLVSTLWNGQPAVFRNDGGTFVDVTAAAGISTAVPYSHQAVLHDFDRDGRLDIYVAVDFRWNALYLNQGNWSFDDVAAASDSDNPWNDMSIAPGDRARDDDLDIFITNITEPGSTDAHTVLLRNDGPPHDLRFSEQALDLDLWDCGWAWGTTWLDADADGWLDLVATNGWGTPTFVDDVTRFFWNRGGPPMAFERVDGLVGVGDDDWGSAVLALDADRDGDLDLLQTFMDAEPRLLRNEPADPDDDRRGAWLVVRPRMSGPNPRAIGAEIRVVAGGERHLRLITAGTSYLGQEPAEAHVGLGVHDVAELVEVRWPDGSVTRLRDVPARQVLDVTDRTPSDPIPGDLDGDDRIGAADLLLLLRSWGRCGDGACPADLDGPDGTPDDRVDQIDLARLLAGWTG